MQKDTYEIARVSTDKVEIIDVIRRMEPGTIEAGCLIWCLEHNKAYDAELRLEVICKAPNMYKPYQYTDYIIQCAENTELLQRLCAAVSNTNASKEVLKSVIEVTTDDKLRELAYHTLREISST